MMSKAASERNIKVTVEYNGLNYHGFQRQPHHQTIQAELEKALSQLFNQPLKIQSASGRTDSGVSAAGQVVNFKVSSRLALEKIQNGLNALLPKDIAITAIKEVSSKFHARYSAKAKTYEYCIWNSPRRSPLKDLHWYHVPYALDAGKMKRAAKYFVGTHDFKSFCASDPAKPNRDDTVRTLKKLQVIQRGREIRLKLEADGFLYKMVRNIVGTLTEVGSGRISVTDIPKIIRARDRCRAGKTVPAEALCLIKVTY